MYSFYISSLLHVKANFTVVKFCYHAIKAINTLISNPKYLYPNMEIKVSKLNYSSHFILYSKVS
jgi:hypothetical protein